jgi:phosphoglycolate phosphatase
MRGSATLLLDLDGTLSDNFAGISASIRHALSALSAPPVDDATLRGCVGPPLRESFARIIDGADDTVVERAIVAYRERYGELGWQENVAYPGVGKALESLAQRGARRFVCTAKAEPYAKRIIAHFGFDAFIERVYGADLAGTLDDKRRLLAHLIASEALDPRDCTMIGDRHHDIRAARTNATGAIGVLWGYGSREELAGADRLLETPDDLVTLA